MLKGMTFNGIRKSHIYLLEGRQKASFAPISRNITSTRKGHRLKDSKHELLPISQPIGYIASNDVDALEIKDELAEWLITKDVAPLQFDDEPGRTYWAVVQNSIDDLSRLAFTRQGTIQFLCFYTTGATKSINVTTTSTNHTITGQTKTPWTIEVNFTADTNRFEFWAGDIYLQLNYNFKAGEKLIVNYTGRKVTLNGNDLRKAVSMSSNFEELTPGIVSVRASHAAKLIYDERYY
ncbi:distal tail protein Dit [Oceanobacillus profundus]|uniref:distal tail protein Dit n=1 Tax=Oceanobacillus profundus TaxID=372463 RepID=UPI0026E17C26|nr:distal tail protein Dit [Oceanobacillus profundus]MDO6451715.1 phage tail family protein [Oceanobacillus profundus]